MFYIFQMCLPSAAAVKTVFALQYFVQTVKILLKLLCHSIFRLSVRGHDGFGILLPGDMKFFIYIWLVNKQKHNPKTN